MNCARKLYGDQRLSKTWVIFRNQSGGKTHKRYLGLPPTLFQRTMANSETVRREWLSYSRSTGNVYCVPCKLFSSSKSLFRVGFSDWNHCQSRVLELENSAEHKNSLTVWRTRKITACRVDCNLVKQVELERKYWRDVLQRAVEVIKFLAERGLPFRGDDEVFGSTVLIMATRPIWESSKPSSILFYVSIYRDMVVLVGVLHLTCLRQFVRN